MLEKFSISEEDKETVINYSRYHIGEWAEVYTTDKFVMKRYEKFAEKHPTLCKILKDDEYSMTFGVDPRCASIYPRAPRSVNMTDEEKMALAQRLIDARNRQ